MCKKLRANAHNMRGGGPADQARERQGAGNNHWLPRDGKVRLPLEKLSQMKTADKVERKEGMEEERVAVPDWHPLSCL